MRRSYFGEFGREECDEITAPNPQIPGVLVFERGCNSSLRVIVIASFDTEKDKTVRVPVSWPSGTHLADCLVSHDPLMLIVSALRDVTVMLKPLEALVLVPLPVAKLPPTVVSMSPSHGSHAAWSANPGVLKNITLRFDRAMEPSVVDHARLDGQPAYFRCASSSCSEIFLQLDVSTISNGFHSVEIEEEARSTDGHQMHVRFTGSFIVDRSAGVLAKPHDHHKTGLICGNWTHLCHNVTGAAIGADWFRMKNIDGSWSEWQPMALVTEWQSYPGVAVLVQYHAQHSASFVVGDCLGPDGRACFVSWHGSMELRGDFNAWGENRDRGVGPMTKIDHFTWATTLTLDRFVRAKFAPYSGWDISYGIHPDRELLYNMPAFDDRYYTFSVEPTMSGSEASRKWMAEKKHWTEHQSLASGAEFAMEFWLSHLCVPTPPECVPASNPDWEKHGFEPGQDQEWCRTVGVQNCVEYRENDRSPAMKNCGEFSCCKRKVSSVPSGEAQTCCVLFNDLLLNYTVTSDLSKCGTTLTTTVALATCPPRPVTLEEAEVAGRAQINPYAPDAAAIQATLQWSRERVREAEKDFEEPEGLRSRMASPESWHEEVAYSIMVDRFANGDLTNDEVNLAKFQVDEMESGQPWSIHQWRHGGDLQGVKGRLTYLKQLGVSSVVLSPIFLNEGGEYHGFCTSDVSKIDPGFGTPELLRDLVQDAHALDMRVLLDVQVNHVCAKGMRYTRNPVVEKVSKCVKETEMSYWGLDRHFPLIPSENRQELTWSDLPKYLQHDSFFIRCGPKAMYRPGGVDFIKLGAENVTSIDAGFSFPEYFSETYFELNTMDSALQELYTNLLKYWVAFTDIDGYRISAAAHITADFSAYLSTNLRFYTAALGKQNFLVVGEIQQSTSPLGFMHVGRVQPAQGPAYLPKRVQGVMQEMCPYYSALKTATPGFLSTYPIQESFLVREIAAGSSKPMALYERADWQEAVMRSRGILMQQGHIGGDSKSKEWDITEVWVEDSFKNILDQTMSLKQKKTREKATNKKKVFS